MSSSEQKYTSIPNKYFFFGILVVLLSGIAFFAVATNISYRDFYSVETYIQANSQNRLFEVKVPSEVINNIDTQKVCQLEYYTLDGIKYATAFVARNKYKISTINLFPLQLSSSLKSINDSKKFYCRIKLIGRKRDILNRIFYKQKFLN